MSAGPQTDLHWVTVDAVRTAAMDSENSEAWRFQSAEVNRRRKGGGFKFCSPWAPQNLHF